MRILFLQKRLVVPPDTGGKIRTHNVLKHLAQWHEVTYVSNLLPSEAPYCRAMQDLGVELVTVPWTEPSRRSGRFLAFAIQNLLASRFPLNVDKDYDPKLRHRVETLLTQQKFDLLICDFVQMARNALGMKVPSLLFQHNVEAEIFARLASTSRWPLSSYLRLQHRRMVHFERSAGEQFTRVVAVSPRDREIFENDYQWPHVRVIDTAVDTEYFLPDRNVARNPHQLLFVGSLDWLPNQQGIAHFVEWVFPSIQREVKDVSLVIVGRHPSPRVRSLAERPGITLAASVPDIRPWLAQAAVAIVPMYAGGGTRLKIFEAMASEIPVVSTPLGAEGLAVEHDHHLLLADSDEAFSAAVTSLLLDPARAARLATAARQLVVERFDTRSVARQFESICFEAAEQQGVSAHP